MAEKAAISFLERDRRMRELESRRFDCLVIGGGITGAGVIREAARRGLEVALLEADDFAAGTSSRSSKLIHGGLRYLAQGEVKLVRDTALERKEVHREAPHLAEPAWMVVPSRSRASHMKFRAGIATYEKLGDVAKPDRHQNWGREELALHEPALDRERYAYACVYREYTTDDARLVLANLRAAAEAGATVANRLRVDSLVFEDGHVAGAEAVCGWTGRRIRIRARSVVNAAGPWVPGIRDLEKRETSSLLHLSKGIHVVLPRSVLPVRHLVAFSAGNRRSIFVVPRGEIVYVGTTDTSWPAGPDHWPTITQGDVDYLLRPLPEHFCIGPISHGDCQAAWSGLRPLIAHHGKKPSEISRRDEIWEGATGLISIAGGKLTGYRKMARSVLSRLAQQMDMRFDESRAEDCLPGGDFDGNLAVLAQELERETATDPAMARRLVRLYGTDAASVAAMGPQPLVPGSPVLAGEVDWAIVCEEAACLEDFVYRRSRVAYYEPHWCDALLLPAAQRMQARLGWDGERTGKEVQAVQKRRSADLDFSVGGKVSS